VDEGAINVGEGGKIWID